jgi:hypothetical protein
MLARVILANIAKKNVKKLLKPLKTKPLISQKLAS